MIDLLGEAIPKYNQWVRMRLEARHMGASGDFFEDANRLGTALQSSSLKLEFEYLSRPMYYHCQKRPI